MKGHLLMSAKERARKVEFEGVREGGMTIVDASEKLGLSYRHCRRSYKRFREQGDAGLVYRNRGRTSNRAKPLEFREAVFAPYRERYEGLRKIADSDRYDIPSTIDDPTVLTDIAEDIKSAGYGSR